MKIEKKLEELLQYFMSSRQAGHSTLIKKGTENYDRPFLVLTHTTDDANFLDLKPSDIVSLQSLTKLRGCNKPLAIDNGAMTDLLLESIMRITELKDEYRNLLDENIKLIEKELKRKKEVI